ncbi:MAG: hypothetical protein WEC59_10350 [Salibacteraceae bacterium]
MKTKLGMVSIDVQREGWKRHPFALWRKRYSGQPDPKPRSMFMPERLDNNIWRRGTPAGARTD